MHYWDTSTLAKLYISEPDSTLFEGHLASAGMAATSELTRWEFFRVAARKEAEGYIGAGKAEVVFAKFLVDVAVGRMTLVPFAKTLAAFVVAERLDDGSRAALARGWQARACTRVAERRLTESYNQNQAGSALQPGGLADSSRGLSLAIPPDHAPMPSAPRRVVRHWCTLRPRIFRSDIGNE